MNALIVNDTRTETNFGCHLTIDGLSQILKSRGIICPNTIPLGSFDMPFRDAFKRQFTLRRQFNHYNWETIVARIAKSLGKLCRRFEVAIINGEGTLHHSRVSTVALIGFIEALHRIKMPTILCNCSLEDIPQSLLETIAKCDHVAVREAKSLRYAKSQGIAAVQAADCLFANENLPTMDSQPKHRVYSPGVAIIQNPNTVFAQIDSIRKSVDQLDILCINKEDLSLYLTYGVREGVDIIPPANTLKDLVSILSQADGVVTGRYHLAILSAIYSIPIEILPSNTWKNDGLKELLELEEGLCRIEPDKIANAKKLAQENLPKSLC